MSFLSKIAAASHKQDVARYLWFIVKSDGSIYEGIESRDDAKDSLKELKETDKNAKIVSRSKVDPAKLADFFKNHGIPQRMIDKGLQRAKHALKMSKEDPWGHY